MVLARSLVQAGKACATGSTRAVQPVAAAAVRSLARSRPRPVLRTVVGLGAPRPGRVPAGSRGYAEKPSSGLDKTELHYFHVAHGGKMVPFGFYSMPLHYEGGGGQVAEHKHVRTAAGLFDVGHMVQSVLHGPSSTAFLASLVPSSVSSLTYDNGIYSSSLSVLLNENGGILDDLMITRQDEEKYYLVTNAACRYDDLEHLYKKLHDWNGKDPARNVTLDVLEHWGLIALQGPKAAEVLQPLVNANLHKIHFGQSFYADIDGVRCHIARGGYTGEDGFEISIPPSKTLAITEKIAHNPDVKLAGLAARDSLRLEAGLCLYGHDLNAATTPIEGTLAWLVGKDRRESADFPGASNILQQIKNGANRRRVGLIVSEAPAREGAKIFDAEGKEEIGVVTSGIPSPTLGKNIAMGYVDKKHFKRGTGVTVEVRKKLRKAEVTKMPFVESKYYRG